LSDQSPDDATHTSQLVEELQATCDMARAIADALTSESLARLASEGNQNNMAANACDLLVLAAQIASTLGMEPISRVERAIGSSIASPL
jgi:hypothetical protein